MMILLNDIYSEFLRGVLINGKLFQLLPSSFYMVKLQMLESVSVFCLYRVRDGENRTE